jgi:hypothetical protein
LSSAPSTATLTATADPGLSVTKSASPTSVSAVGQTVTYSFLVTNTGNVTISGITIDEGAFTGAGSLSAVTCPAGAATLAPDDSVTCTATYSITQADLDSGSVSNTATASGTDPTGTPISSPPSTSTVTVDAQPGLSLVKSASPTEAAGLRLGTLITYSFVVTNTGNVTLTDAGVDDTSFSGSGTLSPIVCPAGAAVLAPGSSVTCTATYTVTQADVDAATLTNTATSSASPPTGVPGPTGSLPSTVTLPETPQPALTVAKTASPATVSKAGQTVMYSFLVTNSGNQTLTGATVDEAAFTGSGTLSAVSCPAAAASLPPGAQVTCTATYSVTQADIDSGSVANTATVAAHDPGGGVVTSPPSTATVRSTAVSRLHLTKTAHAVDVNHDGVIDQGDRIDWHLVATNLGATTITGIVVVDPSAGKVSCPRTTLAPGASMSCTVAPHTVTAADVAAGQVRNVATAHGRVNGTTSVSSAKAHAAVTVFRTPHHVVGPPSPGPSLPFTGFGPTRDLTEGAVVLLLVGGLLLAGHRPRRPQILTPPPTGATGRMPRWPRRLGSVLSAALRRRNLAFGWRLAARE